MADLVFKELVKEMLVCGSYILQIEGHYFITIMLLVHGKGCHFFILEGYLNLVISKESIDEAK